MEDTPRAGPSFSGKGRRRSPSPDRARKRPRAVVKPNFLKRDQIIRPVFRENHNIQVAVLKMSKNGQYYLIRTGPLLIDPAKTQALNETDPVPVMLPNDNNRIANIATVLSTELVPTILPNVENHHHEMLLNLEEEENRIISMRQTVRELERQSPNKRVMRAWSYALQVMNPTMGDRLPQALEYEHYASIFIPGMSRKHSSPPRPPQPPVSNASHYRRRLRAIRRHRRHVQLDPVPADQSLPLFWNPLDACRDFLNRLNYMSLERPPRLERVVRLLMQLMVDNVLGPEQFCQRLEQVLDANAQPYLVRFLKENMRRLRQSLYLRFSKLNGIERPRRRVAFPVPEPQFEMPEVKLETNARPESPSRPIAAVAPLQPIPLSHLPYDLPVPMSPIHFDQWYLRSTVVKLWQVERGGLSALTKTVPKEGDMHLYNPRVGYVHLSAITGVKYFQLGDTTIKVLQKKPTTPSSYFYTY